MDAPVTPSYSMVTACARRIFIPPASTCWKIRVTYFSAKRDEITTESNQTRPVVGDHVHGSAVAAEGTGRHRRRKAGFQAAAEFSDRAGEDQVRPVSGPVKSGLASAGLRRPADADSTRDRAAKSVHCRLSGPPDRPGRDVREWLLVARMYFCRLLRLSGH